MEYSPTEVDIIKEIFTRLFPFPGFRGSVPHSQLPADIRVRWTTTTFQIFSL